MVIIAISPYIEFVIFYALKKIKIFYDRGYMCKRKPKAQIETKKTTVQQFVDLYSGPVYMIHFRYSSIMVQVYVSFMFGMCIPLLFPIALFGLFNIYLVERLSLAYYNSQPPLYDLLLNKQALDWLLFPPFFMFAFGYWGLGNRQIFFNQVDSRVNANEILNPEHPIFDFE